MSINIENDVVVRHGRWCLERAAYAENRMRIESVMNERRAHLKKHPEDFVADTL